VLVEQILVQHPGARGRGVDVVLEDVPPAKDDVVEIGEGHEVLDQGDPVVGPLAEANGAHLGEAAEGLGLAPADGLDAGDKGGGHRTHAGEQDAELALGGLNGGR